jgi:DNA-binding NarL/FixJ family response regulator
VLLAEGDALAAVTELRTAASAWRSLHMPYDEARTAVLVGLACAAMGDRTSAALEFDNARDTFTELGAVPDLARVPRPAVEKPASSLSSREREVLGHVAAGRTNREIAEKLVISEHTVGRHIENIYAKLGVTSRAAATAYAYQHDLL